MLEGFQSGLSWITILRKRENFRKAFHSFDPARIARYGDKDIGRLMQDDFTSLARHGSTEPFRDHMLDFAGLNEVLGTADMLDVAFMMLTLI